MVNKKFLILVVIVLLSLSSLVACVNEEKTMDFVISPSNKTIVELTTKQYSDEEMNDIISFVGTMQELCSVYPAECVREIDTGYRIAYLGDSTVAVLIFDREGNYLFGNLYNLSLDESNLSSLSNGSTLEDSMRVDPQGKYLFLYTGTNNLPRQSYHCTTDGYLITIEYDDNNSIISIESELI